MAVIDRNRWRELEPLLDQALAVAEEEQAAWLGELRSRSPELAAELTALLASDAAAGRHGFLDRDSPDSVGMPSGTCAAQELGTYLQSALGDTYTIERELGGGGMSRVFLAREQALGRAVVLKVLRPVLAAGLRAERLRGAGGRPCVVPPVRVGGAPPRAPTARGAPAAGRGAVRPPRRRARPRLRAP